MSSPSQTDYLNGAIRKSIIPIVRIIKSKSGETTLLGKIKLSSMIPVYDKSVIKEYDINHEIDTKYKNLVFDQLDFINSNKKLIIKYANTLYRQKIKNFSIGYVNQTVNFLLLEEKSKLYNK
ncbi:type III toxin-antitoxin system ToxN/AbiQ family toxin [Leptotrichia trevisanii]|uniref:Type III toxin-antitoxin system like protein n=1 Tax=Leptotrichia trevisanii TaxID=109328 RepID=A0A510JXQ3_9FUSO|nr:type III toxin-antitoxin system ToxN/AbiQ family toxin [Leptotrichia trevisanii]BBM43954.1 type III toxin-antitoxin system like protein [Leptotrichia trevisanii]